MVLLRVHHCHTVRKPGLLPVASQIQNLRLCPHSVLHPWDQTPVGVLPPLPALSQLRSWSLCTPTIPENLRRIIHLPYDIHVEKAAIVSLSSLLVFVLQLNEPWNPLATQHCCHPGGCEHWEQDETPLNYSLFLVLSLGFEYQALQGAHIANHSEEHESSFLSPKSQTVKKGEGELEHQ